MMSKLIKSIILSTLAWNYTQISLASTIDQQSLVGIWAMMPLNNGIANVVEYKADGQVVLHPFNCQDPSKQGEAETSNYKVDQNNQTIQIIYPDESILLKVLEFTDTRLTLEHQDLEDIKIVFTAKKSNEIKPLCDMYDTLKKKN